MMFVQILTPEWSLMGVVLNGLFKAKVEDIFIPFTSSLETQSVFGYIIWIRKNTLMLAVYALRTHLIIKQLDWPDHIWR